jgi:hypothetical protein
VSGAIGLYLTGGFALSMAVDPVILAPVLGEPSLRAWPAALDISPSDLDRVKARTGAEGLTIRGYLPAFRATNSVLHSAWKPCARSPARPSSAPNCRMFAATPQACVPGASRPISVFTIDLIDAPGEPTRAAVDEIITYFRENLLGPQLRPGEEQSA